MKIIKNFILFFVCVLSACTLPQQATEDVVPDIVNNITYIKDKYGICYATILSTSYGGYRIISITQIPCEKVPQL